MEKHYHFKVEKIGEITTSPEFWDCECDTNYIIPKGLCSCPKCGAKREDQPDSHADEIEELMGNKV